MCAKMGAMALLEFCKSLFWHHGGRRWVAMSGPSALLWLSSLVASRIGINCTDALYFLVKPQWWTWALAVSAGLLLASYLAWREQYTLNKSLVDGRPRIVLADYPIERLGVDYQISLPANIDPPAPERILHLIYTSLRVRVANEPIVNTPNANTKVNARVSFWNERNERVCVIDGRWADSVRPRERDQSQDFVEYLSAPFPVGSYRSLDLMFIRPNENYCVAVNYDSFDHSYPPYFEVPGRQLHGLIKVVAELNGTNVKSRITLQVDCNTMTHVGSVQIEDFMPRISGG